MNDKEREFWDIFSKLQKLCHLSNEDIYNKEVSKHLKLMSNMIYFYRREGVKKVKEAERARYLKQMGVTLLKPKVKK